MIRAAGGAVLQDGALVLVHRPEYDDWTLPKGKAHAGESDEECAIREVEEETGLWCTLGDELPSSRYIDGRGRPKIVRYWVMTPVGGALRAANEIDEARWVPLEHVAAVLSYERDRQIVRAL